MCLLRIGSIEVGAGPRISSDETCELKLGIQYHA